MGSTGSIEISRYPVMPNRLKPSPGGDYNRTKTINVNDNDIVAEVRLAA